MKSFTKVANYASVSTFAANIELVRAEVTFQPRTLVCVNERGTVYQIDARIRDAKPANILKAIVKAALTSKRETILENSTEEVKLSKNRQVDVLSPVLSSSLVFVTGKDGHMIGEPWCLSDDAGEAVNLRQLVRITASKPLYKLVVEQGLPWDNVEVSAQLNAWVAASLAHLTFRHRLDEALAKCAESNEAAEIAEELAAKKEADKAAAEAPVA